MAKSLQADPIQNESGENQAQVSNGSNVKEVEATKAQEGIPYIQDDAVESENEWEQMVDDDIDVDDWDYQSSSESDVAEGIGNDEAMYDANLVDKETPSAPVFDPLEYKFCKSGKNDFLDG
ncbi:hypothetical protein EC973_006321 [Apophysomyces ossiformis]|uniref:Uncharacterized protein n=1 Tax=Apophysomyces ossiformis TaxID=679940 RepID=A0A8H7ELQ1_9FUNG|nr:hypothetical protein EC973_006321 [Apophysomyces ossiformis]